MYRIVTYIWMMSFLWNQSRSIVVVSTHLKNISQIGSIPQVAVTNFKELKPAPRGKYTPDAPCMALFTYIR